MRNYTFSGALISQMIRRSSASKLLLLLLVMIAFVKHRYNYTLQRNIYIQAEYIFKIIVLSFFPKSYKNEIFKRKLRKIVMKELIVD